jgi:thioredoxin-like negative regulator of GroEL
VAKPIVDGLERDLNGKANVVRLDLLSSVGRQAAYQYGVRAVPTIILVDGSGEVKHTQYGLIRAGAVEEEVNQLVGVGN